MRRFLFVGLALLTGSALADEACDQYQTAYDQTYCMAKLFLASDDELNQVYKDLKSQLQGNTAKKLTNVQRQWISYRDSNCQAEGKINVRCNYHINKARTEYLRDRLRECKTGNCRLEAIIQPSW